MKKLYLIIIAVFVMVFLLLTYLKNKSSVENDTTEKPQKDLADKKQIRDFWQYYRQATQYRIAGDWQNAVSGYTKALQINDKHEDALYYLGNMHFVTGQYHEAEKKWKQLLEINPKNTRAHFRLGYLYLSHNLEDFFDINKAETEFRKTLELNKEESAPLLYLGQIFLVRGQDDVAKNYFSDVIKSNFKSVEAHLLLGYINWKEGDPDNAHVIFSRAVEYSKKIKPKENDVIGEGDTKAGISFINAADHSIFYTYLQRLALMEGSRQEMNAEYLTLKNYLAEINQNIN